jgi:RimJ/RimL family protein N-acetyltransferase
MYRVDEKLRLRWPVMEEFHKGWTWYTDPEIQYLVNGTKEPFTLDQTVRMFDFLNNNGEFFFIEVYEEGKWIPVGDATLMHGQKNDVPITIGDKNYHRKGIGSKILRFLIDKAKDQGFDKLVVHIYSYNEASIAFYQKFGFVEISRTDDGANYQLIL